MDRKLVTHFAPFVVTLVLAAASSASAAHPNMIGGYGQSNCECDCEVSCCQKHWRCMYGQMVNDGMGGSFRLYGYPKPPCCCRQPCGYPTWGMGNACFPECYDCHHRCRQRRYYRANGFYGLLPSRLNGTAMAWCAAPPLSCSGAQSDCNIIQATHRTVKSKASGLPRTLKLASLPSPIKLAR